MKKYNSISKFTSDPWRMALIFVLLSAAVLRFVAVGFGLPELLHVDEPFEMHRALRLATGDFDFTRTGKGGFYFIIFLELAISFIFLFAGRFITGPDEFASFFVAHEGAYYWVARSSSACIGIAACFVLYKIASEINGRECGLLGAVLLAVSALHVETSHYATVDGLLVLLLLLSWLYIFRILREENYRNHLLAAFWGGLALATKLPAILIIVPMLGATIISAVNARYSSLTALKRGVTMLGVFMAAALILEPGYFNTISHLGNTLQGIFVISGEVSEKLSVVGRDQGPEVSPAIFYFQHLRMELGTPLLLAALASMVWTAIIRPSMALLLISFILPYFFAISQAKMHLVFPRYLLPLLPLVLLIVSYGVSEFYLFLRRRLISPGLNAPVLISLIAVLIWAPCSSSLSFVGSRANIDTRISAKDWIEQNIRPGSAILMEGSPEHQSQFDIPLLNTAENMDKVLISLRGDAPGKAHYLRLKKDYYATLPRPRFDLRFVNWDDPYPSLEDIKGQGVEYLVLTVSSLDVVNARGTGDDIKDSRIRFVKRLAKEKGIVKIYEVKNNGACFGPHVAVYRLG